MHVLAMHLHVKIDVREARLLSEDEQRPSQALADVRDVLKLGAIRSLGDSADLLLIQGSSSSA